MSEFGGDEAATAATTMVKNIAYTTGGEVRERRRRGGDDHLAVAVLPLSGVDSEGRCGGIDSTESPPPRLVSTYREAARATCRGSSGVTAGCEGRLCVRPLYAANQHRGVWRICKKGEPKRTID